MTTDAHSASREVHEFYIARVNEAVGQGREWLIAGLIADYEKLVR